MSKRFKRGLLGLVVVLAIASACRVWAASERPDGLVEALGSTDAQQAAAAAHRLEAMGKDAWPVLRLGMSHPSERVRARSIHYVAVIQEGAVGDDVARCLEDPSGMVQIQAAAALRVLRNWSDPSPLLTAIQRRSLPDRVRIDLIEALGCRHERRVLPILARLLGDRSEPWAVRARAALPLGRLERPARSRSPGEGGAVQE